MRTCKIMLKATKIQGNNFPGGNFPGGHFSGGHFSRWQFSWGAYFGGQFSRGHFSGGLSSRGHFSGHQIFLSYMSVLQTLIRAHFSIKLQNQETLELDERDRWHNKKKVSSNIANIIFCGRCFKFSLSRFMKILIQAAMPVSKLCLESVCR